MSIIGLKKANCKNCYKCVKVCPVKSIKVENEQAQIVDRTCILCGTCLEQCPQDAKTVNSDAARVREMLRDVYKRQSYCWTNRPRVWMQNLKQFLQQFSAS